ncbi:MAG: hypothetical protein KZQ64_03285 [gamma proteobacterium symbiont of Bathyaustriella thionipta]|nr:hypothetical protein [gamma proteobacterium symbiont of Bathyaustriella thionipta]MCU7951228.1 hypothetical protein [gamma proteobacterium symbiont of Bathyaustriella thionipta]MCU7952405.1 hypothetical protein [gamma proteobacterium symbiont of Bathyaustriella thionipta]MCU7957753.1 hypothetical protein [gamma proteobacterium symbiont of Bathyaustriella thionipta]MCU7966042.1 hypothetical protein [gamma proteobacterium symbiont of Bathyaustriella thionipta]
MSYVTKYQADNQFTTSERCTINELLNNADNKHCSIAKASVQQGITTQLHTVKNSVEYYIILEGEAEVFINNSPAETVGYLDVVTGVDLVVTTAIPDQIIFS